MPNNFYRYLIKEADLCVIAIRKKKTNRNEPVIGFIISGNNVSKGVSNFISDNRLYLLTILLRHPQFIYEMALNKLNSILNRYPKTTSQYRLASMGVLKEMQSIGIGKKMLVYFESIIAERVYKLYGLSVRKNNLRAIDFYLNNGFNKEISRHSVLLMVKEI